MSKTKSTKKKLKIDKLPEPLRHDIESNAIYTALACGVFSFITGLILFSGNMLPLYAGTRASLGLVATLLGFIITFVVYLAATRTYDPKGLRKITNWSLALTHALLAFLIFALMFYILEQAFKDVLLRAGAASTILGISGAIAGYISYLSAANISTLRVAILLAAFLFSGVFVSMITAHDPHWWNYNFSALGAGSGISSYAFNDTLIIAGLVVIALTSFISSDFIKLKHEGEIPTKAKGKIVQWSLALMGLGLAGVGLFVVNHYPTIHVASAVSMAVTFGLLMVSLPWVVPSFPRSFFILSYMLLGAISLSGWLFLGPGYFNLTVVELISAGIIFTWLIIFVRITTAKLDDDKTKTVVK